MVGAIARIVGWLAAGEALARVAGLPVPGAVVGLVLLYLDLSRAERATPELDKLADTALPLLGIVFVPAGVGVLAYVDILKQEVVPVLAAVLGGTIITLAVTGVAAAVLTRATAPRPQHRPLELSDGIA